MSGPNEAREGGLPLQLPIDAPELPRSPSTSERPQTPANTMIEIDLVITDDDKRAPRRIRHDDADHEGDTDPRDRSRGTVIEISLV